jgi:hypothetical protein
MELPFVSPPSLVVDSSDAWFLCRSADNKRLMIIHTVYDIGVARGKDHPDTPCALNGLNLQQYPARDVYVFEQDPCSDGPTGFVVWKQVNSLGGHSVFLGLNYPITINLKICDC